MSLLPETPQLNRDYARLLLVMRKLIRSEFEVSLPLDRPETPILLVHYARRSSDSMLHEMADELDELLAKQEGGVAHSAEPEVPRYRGAVISAQQQEVSHAEEAMLYRGVALPGDDEAHPPHEERRVKRVYRGQVIEE